ncbi:zinc-binding dehydrogenase [Amycolatopsis sp. NBC_01480]|jgi:NADPH:quinone reductase-like Zn-dependent oxidoreductase|uniref:zinc-binding dehydrogenase n=1 Tax=Amycolatopsis sp. NBC_01480 TaxID=2903562 RepID=UPI002E292F47|nr:zinc-binding dehydrogenase [Amycolatopsis sp. NBC_01480]
MLWHGGVMDEVMTAVVLPRHGGIEALELHRDWPVPRPGPGEVLVRVTAAALNNTDVWTREGAYGTASDPDALSGWRGPIDFPRIQGGDIAGVAVESGRRVLVDPAIYQDGSRDAPPVGLLGSEADGGFAEYVVVPADQVHDVTSSPLSDEELACLPVAYGTAMGMLERAGLEAGEKVLVTGASGGVGAALVQLAAARGARAFAVTSAAKADAVMELGASGVILRDGAGDVATQVSALGPLDAVADVAGGPLLADLLPLLRDDGRWVIAGAVAGALVQLDLRRLYLHNIRLIGSSMHTRPHFAELVRTALAGTVRPPVAATHPLTSLSEAQQQFLHHNHVGKIVVRP